MFWKYVKQYKFKVLLWAWQYIRYLTRHIFFVAIGCFKVGLPLAGITHDWSKWLPSEFIPYMLYFYGPKFPTGSKVYDNKLDKLVDKLESPADIKEAFDYAWNYHQKRQPHHWQYWLLSPDRPRPQFSLGSHGPAQGYGVEIYEVCTGKHTNFYKDPTYVNGENTEDYLQELRLEESLMNTPVCLDIPMRYRKELLADWRGAGRATGKPDTPAWYKANRYNIFLHPNTRAWIEEQLGVDPEVRSVL